MKHALRLFHTVRYLKTKQIIYRLYYRWRRLSLPLVQDQTQVRLWEQDWYSPQWLRPGFDPDGQFNFLNEPGRVESSKDWNNPAKSKLWLYNLHYLDELNAQNADKQVEALNNLIGRWIDDNPVLHGIGWEPYPLSLRIVNLTKWQMRRQYNGCRLLNSIQQQTIALSKQIEYHIMANHLFTNGKALVFAGAALKNGNNFLQQGLSILDKEIPEQFLIDGGHFELSPMYHAILLWDMCDLLNLAKISGISELQIRIKTWTGVIERGLVWLNHMLHPDGDISFFNDSTLGIAPSYADLCQYATLQGITTPAPQNSSILSVKHLHESGYIILESDLAKLIMDVGPIGADYQPGHAHADTLSFELSLFGQRVFVNSGISQYGISSERSYQRSTQAHNTMVVDGKNSSDVWGGFRVGRRAHTDKPQLTQDDTQVTVRCSHHGYRTSFNPLTHVRQWLLNKQSCQIIDTLSGTYQQAQVHYHLHPEIQLKQFAADRFELKLPMGKTVSLQFAQFASVCIENTHWYHSFNRMQANLCLVAIYTQLPLHINITW